MDPQSEEIKSSDYSQQPPPQEQEQQPQSGGPKEAFLKSTNFDEETAIDYFEALKNYSSLESLSFDFSKGTKLTDDISPQFFDTINHLKKLTSLALNLSDCEDASDITLAELTKSINNKSEQITSLDLNLSWCRQLSKQSLLDLFATILKLKSPTKLSLMFPNIIQLDNECLITLSQGLRNFTELTELKLSLWGCATIDIEGIKKLGEALQSLTKIQNLVIDLSMCQELDSKALTFIGQGIQKMNKLEEVAIHLDSCIAIDHLGIKEVLEALKESKETLTSISLSLYKCSNVVESPEFDFSSFTKVTKFSLNLNENAQLEEKQIVKFVNKISQATNIEDLTLNISGNPNIKKLEELDLSTLQKLESFSLNLTKSRQLSSLGIKSIMTGLVKLNNLKTLDMNFKACALVGSIALAGILKLTANNLSNLTSLILNFSYCVKMIKLDKAPNSQDQDWKLTKLETFEINLSFCEELEDSFYSGIEQFIQSLKSLKNLSISQKECEKITDNGMISLFKGLKELNLESFKLDLGDTKLGNETLLLLADFFKGSKELIDFDISMERCEGVSDKSMAVFGESLCEMCEKEKCVLENLQMVFIGCKGISGDSVKLLIKAVMMKYDQLRKLKLLFDMCGKFSEEIQETLFQIQK